MKAKATLTLNINIDEAREMGYEIEDPKDYAITQFMDYVYEALKSDINWIEECIEVEIEGN